MEQCKDGRIYAVQRNKFSVGDELEVLAPAKEPYGFTVTEILDGEGNSVESANHATMKLSVPCDMHFPAGSVIRMQK